ncbi:MAG: VOC family protein [Oligoflexales bacterium]
MDKQIWLNLASRDLKKTRVFYERIGATINEKNPPNLVSIVMGEMNLMINFFAADEFSNFVCNEPCDAHKSNEIIFSIGVHERSEVDRWATRIVQAGGAIFSEPQEIQGWMYNCGFSDPDGHNWNVMYMDLEKIS